jgi:predicted AAA+ superfamily ATPase
LGARHIGKTYSLREFGQNFAHAHYLNFEQNLKLHQIFSDDLSPTSLLAQLELFLNAHININDDLLIFDEIQICPRALTSLKYFCEQLPELAICGAGSLLGLHLSEASSFPVGKVELMYMYPMSFDEFVQAHGNAKLIEALERAEKILPYIHDQLWQLVKEYFIVGGLPEVVSYYFGEKNTSLATYNEVRRRQEVLIASYYADMAKHAGKVNAMHLDRLFKAVPEQLARAQDGTAAKFQFKGVVPGISRYVGLANAIDWLKNAGLIIKVPICQLGELPLSAYAKENSFKLYCFDVGILGALSGLPPASILEYTYGMYKGYFAENFVAQEFLSIGAELYSWQEGKAELEFLRIQNGRVIPIEVKSGWVTQAKSIKVFQQKYKSPYRVIISAKPLQIDHQNGVHYYPLYLCSRVLIDDAIK